MAITVTTVRRPDRDVSYLRAALMAKRVSYEVALGMTLTTIFILTGNVTLSEIIVAQQQSMWFVFMLTLGFVMFAISALAETNRLPFDLPETESELVTGYHTEYSSMKFSMFFIAEYTHMKMMITFRRRRTPRTPIVKRIAETPRAGARSI